MNESENLRRLRCKCRRGMLELDLFLERFLEKHYAGLSDEEKKLFEEMLEASDTDLQQWFLGQARPQNVALLELIEKIR